MPTTVKLVPAFYDDDSTAPPPFPPMLTDQVELFGRGVHRPTTLLTDEVLTPAGLDTISSPKVTTVRQSKDLSRSRQSTPTPEFCLAVRTSKSSHRHASPSPYVKRVGFRRATSTGHGRDVAPSSEDSEESSDGTSDNDSSLSTLSDDTKIPKPPGEPGRPGRGGYTLETALDWNHKVYMRFKVR